MILLNIAGRYFVKKIFKIYKFAFLPIVLKIRLKY